MNEPFEIVDYMAGAGGATTGAFMVSGVKVPYALNHSPIAIKTHAANHPETIHFETGLCEFDVKKHIPRGKMGGMWASPDCTEHSNAKGGQPKNPDSRFMAYDLLPHIDWIQPNIIWVENVPEFIKSGPIDKKKKPIKSRRGEDYIKWVNMIINLGYDYDYRIINAADVGAYTRRKRYFGIFTKPGYPIIFPKKTYSKMGDMGMKKWKACEDILDIKNEGESIFGREFNTRLRKNVRKKLCPNTLQRIAGGIKKYYPEMFFLMKHLQRLNPNMWQNQRVSNREEIVLEKRQFITEHVWGFKGYQKLKDPLKAILTKEAKQPVSVDIAIAKQFLTQYYSGYHASGIDAPVPTITTIDHNYLMTAKSFLAQNYNSNGHPEANIQSVNEPLKAITTQEKHQFITAYYNSAGNPGTQNQSIKKPLNTITTANTFSLATLLWNGDFDIKMRYLTEEELAAAMSFPKDYKFLGSKKDVMWMIGNAVEVRTAKALIHTVVDEWKSRRLL